MTTELARAILTTLMERIANSAGAVGGGEQESIVEALTFAIQFMEPKPLGLEAQSQGIKRECYVCGKEYLRPLGQSMQSCPNCFPRSST